MNRMCFAWAAISYQGWASVDILPVPDADTAARQAVNTLLPHILHKGRVI